MTATYYPGIRDTVYLGEWLFDCSVGSLSPAIETLKYQQRFADGTFFSSYAQPYTGCPRKLSKMSWQLRFERPTEDDIVRLHRLQSYAGHFDFCPWKPVVETWWENTSGTSGRRNALSVISGGNQPQPSPSTRFAAKAIINGSDQTVTWSTIDSTNYRQAWSCSGTGTGYDVYLVYFPVYRVILSDCKIDYPANNREVWTVSLLER